jgi:hypothetical protein
MPQPLYGQVHIPAALNNIATAYLQEPSRYIADRVFPVVPVVHAADKYYKFRKADFFRDQAKLRADGVESAGGGFNVDQGSYSAGVWAFHKDVGDQVRRNADPAVDIDVATTRFIMQTLLIRREVFFMNTYMTTGVWTGQADSTGTAGGTPGTTTPAFWNDDANGDPFTDVATAQTSILQATGFRPNKLVITWPVYQALRKHPLVIDRVKYSMPTYAGTITPGLLANAFDIDEVLVSEAVYNSAAELASADPTMAFIAGKNALLVHTPASPGLMIPAAGYIFAWSGLNTQYNSLGIRISQIPLPWLGLNTVRTEGEMAFDMQVIAGDLGAYFSGIVQ